jgi:hypothetical protein
MYWVLAAAKAQQAEQYIYTHIGIQPVSIMCICDLKKNHTKDAVAAVSKLMNNTVH